VVDRDARIQRHLANELEPYRQLLTDFVAGRISADDFQTEYFERYQNDNRWFPDSIYDIVDGFFADVDAYVEEERLRDPEQGDLGPEELRAKAIALLQRAGFELPPETSST
jgi:hypothetical protein